MGKKIWNVSIDGEAYNVVYSSGLSFKKSYVEINGEKIPFNDMKRTVNKYWGMLQEYEFTFQGGKEGKMIQAGSGQDVVINGISVATGYDYVPVDKLPKWSYIFLVLNAAIALLGGAIPVGMAFLGVSWTMSMVINPRSSTGAKVLQCIGVLAAVVAITLALSFAFTIFIYSL